MIKFEFKDIIKLATHKNTERTGNDAKPEQLSMGIMDSLKLADTDFSAFDDSERRQSGKATNRHRELQVIFVCSVHV